MFTLVTLPGVPKQGMLHMNVLKKLVDCDVIKPATIGTHNNWNTRSIIKHNLFECVCACVCMCALLCIHREGNITSIAIHNPYYLLGKGGYVFSSVG